MIKYLANKLIISITFLILSNTIAASHFDGYDISFKHISGRTYEFEVEFFNSLRSFPGVPDTLLFEVSSTCASGYKFTVYNTNNTAYITPNCAQAFSQSKTTTYRNYYTFPINGCSDFEVKLDQINHINGTAANSLSTGYANKKIFINGVGLLSNNSPKFIGQFKRFANINEFTNFNVGAVDPDGDSLIFKLSNHSRTFPSGHSVANPFGINQFCSIDSKTGILTIKISNYGFYLINIEVEEYRNGVLISKTHREWIVMVIQTPSNSFTISGINFTNKYDTTICKGDTLRFLFQALNGNNTIQPFLETNIPGATISTAGGISYFKWIQHSSISSNYLYNFYIRAENNDCGSYSKVFSIRVDSCTTVGLSEKTFAPEFHLFPNPSSGVITIKNNNQDLRNIEIRDLAGKLIKQKSIHRLEVDMDLSELQDGIYFITQKVGSSMTTKKLILSK